MAAKRGRKRHKRLPEFSPLMGKGRDRISLDLHLATARLLSSPDNQCRDDYADTINVVGLCIQNDRRFHEELAVLNKAAAVLAEPFGDSPSLTQDEKDTIAHAATVIDSILGLLNSKVLYASELAYVQIMRNMQSQPKGERA